MSGEKSNGSPPPKLELGRVDWEWGEGASLMTELVDGMAKCVFSSHISEPQAGLEVGSSKIRAGTFAGSSARCLNSTDA